MTFHLENQGEIGKIIIIVDRKVDVNIIERFLKLCNLNNEGTPSCKIQKIIQGLLFEAGELHQNPTSKDLGSIKSCDYSKSAATEEILPLGTISMKNDYFSMSTNFSINLKKMSMPYKKGIAIGRVIKGLDVLSTINSYGTRFGLPRKTIIIKSCGVVN